MQVTGTQTAPPSGMAVKTSPPRHTVKDFERRLGVAKRWDAARVAALPLTAVATAAAIVVSPAVVVGVSALGLASILAARSYNHRKLPELRAELKELNDEGGLGSDQYQALATEINRLEAKFPQAGAGDPY